MNRSKSIEALIQRAKQIYQDLEIRYQASLKAETIGEEMKVDIKSIFEHLRSCLDYIALELFESCCSGLEIPRRLYFPICKSQENFKKVIAKSFPGLEVNHESIFDFLDSIQPYNNSWIGEFNQLNNKNKHQNLVNQTRTETRQVSVSSLVGGGKITWTSGVRFGGGVSVMGVPIDPRTQLPIPNDRVKTEITILVGFKFSEIDKPVLPFINLSIESVEKIYSEMLKFI